MGGRSVRCLDRVRKTDPAVWEKMLSWFANRGPALIGMEACGAHYWDRELKQLKHEVRLIAPQYVKPWIQTNKNGQADARAICRAM